MPGVKSPTHPDFHPLWATLQERGAGALDDQIMVLVARAIDQAVNLFDRARLQATSEAPLFPGDCNGASAAMRGARFLA